MTLGDIIKEYRKNHNMSMDSFSSKSGISKAYISLLEKNRHPKTGKEIAPSIQCIKQAADAMNMDFNVLFSRLNCDVTLDAGRDIESQEPPYTTIKVLGRVAAGVPIEAVEDVIDTEEIPAALARTGEFFGLQIHGDSMEPDIKDGDIVIVRKQEDAESGNTVIAIVNGDDAVCKRLKKYADGIMLLSSNPKYDPMVYPQEEIERKPVKIIGRVIESRRKF